MTPGSRRLLGAWGPPAGWCLLIFAVSSFPIRTGVDLPGGSDKVAHLVEYGVLGFLAARGFALWSPGGGALRAFLLGAALSAAWGATDEFHQSFVPERTPDPADFLADAAGALAGAGLWALLGGRRLPAPGISAAPSSAAPAPPPPGPRRPPAR